MFVSSGFRVALRTTQSFRKTNLEYANAYRLSLGVCLMWLDSAYRRNESGGGQVSRLHEHRKRSFCFTYARCCVIGLGDSGDYGEGT